MDDGTPKSTGCGLLVLYNNVFRRRNAHSTPASPKLTPSNSKRHRAASESDAAVLVPAKPPNLHVAASPLNSKASAPAYPNAPTKPQNMNRGTGRPRNVGGISGEGELDSMIHDHQRSMGSNMLVRASSGNVMVFGHLGNIRAPGAVTPNRNVLDYLPETAKEKAAPAARRMAGSNNNNNNNAAPPAPEAPEVLCRALSKRLDPEELKEMGNEEYKKGMYAEAVALYDRAILMDPEKASYWSNKAAALIGMGKLIEAVAECKEAVRIDPSYARAHQRLATLYLRLGEAEKALHHYKLARSEAGSEDVSRAHALQNHLSRCNEARKFRDWQTVLKETRSAISNGTDSSPQVFAFQAEGLLGLQRHEEADTTLNSAPKFEPDAATKFFGATACAYQHAVQAQVHMAAGRFEDAVAVAQRAARLDPGSKEVSVVARKSRAMALARTTGNDLFKANKFAEACIAYGEGLNHDPCNAILLCNRAACRTKLSQWEKAIEDCNAALKYRPSYTKARLRRADCNAKLERWEASMQDYEALIHEMPGDEEVLKALSHVQVQLKKQTGEDIKEGQHADNLVLK